MTINIHAAWIGLLLGCIAGAVPGLYFYKSDWLGGYASWPRRMIRLGHIAFFGLGFINLSFAFTVNALKLETGIAAPSVLLLIGAAAMPAVCYLSAWKPAFRNLFFIPAGTISIAIALFTWRIFQL
jgi:hypothetical protein